MSERVKEGARRGKGTFRSLRGHILRKKAARLEKVQERAEGAYVVGEAEDGGGGVTAGDDGDEGGACEFVNRRRG